MTLSLYVEFVRMEQFACAKPVFGSVQGQWTVEYKIFLRQYLAQKNICTLRTKRDLHSS